MYWDSVLKEVLNKKSSKQFFAFTNLNVLQSKNSCHKKTKSKFKSKPKKYFLGRKYPGVYFTERETQSMLLLIKGKTIKEVGKALKLSPRTIEFYIKNMKRKTGCQHKSQLIGKVLESDFLQHIDF